MQFILPLIVLMIGAGAWPAWRRSPASLTTNFQLAGAFMLMLTAIVASTLWIFNRPSSQSPITKVILIVLAIVIVFAAFTAVVFRLTEGRLAHLPKGASLSDIHRRRLFPWIRCTVVSLALLFVGALLLPADWVALPLSLSAVILLLAMSVLYPLYLKARRFDRGMTALMANAWIHWQYTPEQWQSWAAIQRSWERAKTPVFRWKRDWKKLLLPILIMGCFTVTLGNDAPGVKVLIFLGCSAILLLSIAVLTWASRSEPERRYRRMLTARREAYLGADGLYCSGEYTPWILSGNYLVEATAQQDPPARLVLQFDKFTGNSTARIARLIPMPEGSETDLTALEMQLRSCCPKAAIHIAAHASQTA